MNSIKAIVRNGRIETETPLDLPDGTELLIPLPAGSRDDENGWDKSPEGIAAWLKWSDSVQPLIRSEKEEVEAEDWLKRCDKYDAEKIGKDVEGLFQ